MRAQRPEDDHGFTLIELLVVVVILGILIAIAVPVYLNYRRSANDKAAQSDVRAIVTVLEQCYGENGVYPGAATIAATSSAGASATVCTGRSATVSTGTTLKWFPVTDLSTYIVGATNANGTGKTYCYHGSQGGPVTSTSAAGVAFAAVTAYRTAC